MKAKLVPSGRTSYGTNGLDYASALITFAHAELEGGEKRAHRARRSEQLKRLNQKLNNPYSERGHDQIILEFRRLAVGLAS